MYQWKLTENSFEKTYLSHGHTLPQTLGAQTEETLKQQDQQRHVYTPEDDIILYSNKMGHVIKPDINMESLCDDKSIDIIGMFSKNIGMKV